MDTAVTLAGDRPLHLKNPIITASGTFGFGFEFNNYGDLSSLGGIAIKGLSLNPRPGNPLPRIAETPAGMLNSIGLQNEGASDFVRLKLAPLPWKNVAIIANIYGADVPEFAELGELLGGEERIAALEVNISCPNVREGGVQFGQDPRMAAAVTAAVRKAAPDKHIMVKLSPNVTDITEIARAVEDAGADSISCVNTLSGMAVDIRSRKPMLANIIGGLSGPAIKPVALRCVWQVCQAVKIPVVGLGGITCAGDVLEFILVGAHAVQIGTANFMHPNLAFSIVKELPALCDRLGISSLDEFRGSLRV